MSLVRTYASICVYHDEMNEDEMIDILEYEPSWSKGKKDKKPTVCVYSTRDELESTNLAEHFEFLILNLSGLYESIRIDNQFGFESTFSVFWSSSFEGGSGPNLSARHMKFFGELGIDIWFDIGIVLLLINDIWQSNTAHVVNWCL